MEEFETLSNSEKSSSIRSKIKNIQYQKFNLELDILSESAISDPNESYLQEIQQQVNDLNLRQAALKSELDLLEEQEPA